MLQAFYKDHDVELFQHSFPAILSTVFGRHYGLAIIGFKKRSNDFYRRCLETVALDPKDCAMVGDNLYEDMYMANRNGIHTVWIMNPLTKDKHKADVEPEARLPIESLKELPNVIKKVFS